jgi:hypothetical protein
VITRLDQRAVRNLAGVALAWFLILVAAVTGWWAFQPPLHDASNSDLTLVYIGARIGLEHGWRHIYSLDLQHQLFAQLRPGAPFGDGERFLSPPPLAWLTVPLTAFGPAGAFYIWLAASLAAIVAAWWLAAPGTGWTRWLWLLGALAWYPVLYCLSLGQPAPLVLLAVAACWKLSESGRPFPAGIVLGLSVLKPQLALAVPLVLLVAGHWRIAAGWAATALVLAALSLIAIGNQGLSDYQSLLTEAQRLTNNRYFTLAYIVGPGTQSYVAQVLITAIGLVGAFLNRGAGLARLIALGLVTTTLAATYWHLQDFTILVLAVWLFWRDGPPPWQRLWLLVVAVAGELAWPLSPLPILIAVAVWLVFLILPRRLELAAATAS